MKENAKPPPIATDAMPSRWKQTILTFLRRAWPFGAVIVSTFFGVYLYNLIYPAPLPISQNEINQSIQQVMASATPAPAYSSQVYQIIIPSMVYIQTEKENTEEEGFGVGSGVVINDSGDILTAYHVVAEAITIQVFFADGSQAFAEVISAEPESDIAVLHPDRPPELIVPAVLGGSGTRIGDEAYAVGNPLGLTASMSAGVISGFERSIPIEETGQRLEGLIQFDTAVNPGNSGGPLLNRYGQVIGIVTALANPYDQDFFTGIGFAVPIGTALSAAGGGPEY